MSIKVMSHVWEHSEAKEGALLVMLALADFCNDEGVCWPSVERLAEKARLSERQTRYVLRALEESGEIVCEMNAGPKGTNRYTIKIEGGQLLQGGKKRRGQFATRGGQSTTQRGGSGLPPNRQEPSLEPSGEEARAREDSDFEIIEARRRAGFPRPEDEADCLLHVTERIGKDAGEAMFYHYEASGWVRNGTEITNYRAQAQKWKVDEAKFADRSGPRNGATAPGGTITLPSGKEVTYRVKQEGRR